MKNLKALIKIERMPALVMGIYFLVVNLLAGINVVGSMNVEWRCYLERGISGFDYWEIGTRIYESTYTILIGYIIGLLLLVYLQFKKDKSIEIGRFIKALPYTNGQRGGVKIGLGILSFTIPFVIYTIMILWMRSYYTHLFGEIMRVTAFEEISTYLNRMSVYLGIMGVAYIRLVMIYFILIMGEYLISHNVGSLIITGISVIAPYYLWMSITYDLDRYMNVYTYEISEVNHGIRHYIYELDQWIHNVYMSYMDTWGEGIKISGAGYIINYTVTEKGIIVGLIYLLITIICSFVIVKQVKKQRIENADILLPSKLTRYIFIVGVALCSGCLVRDLSKCVLNQVALGYYPRMILYVLLVIGFGIGAFIASKIAAIGMQNKKEV